MHQKIVLGFLFAAAVFAQTPAFEVASVKPSASITSAAGKVQIRIGLTMDADRVDASMMSLADLIQRAYNVKSYQVSGPDWMNSERFDIHAKLPEGAGTDQVPAMLQTLLADRFKLTLHRDTKEHSVYALVVAKGGVKMEEAEPDTDPPGGPAVRAADGGGVRVTAGGRSGGGGDRNTVVMTRGDGPGGGPAPDAAAHINSKMTMGGFADFIARFVDRPVVDMTDLKGTYKVEMDIPLKDLIAAKGGGAIMMGGPDGRGPSDAASDPSGSSFFALVQKLGLKLEPRKAPMEMLVIDRAERVPTEN